MNRRHFLRSGSALLLVLPFGSFLVQACYASDSPAGDAPAAPPAISGTTAIYTSSVDGDHAHTFAIALAAFTAATDVHGQTSSDEGHTHSVAISGADLANAQSGATVKVTTGTSESHTHVLTIVRIE